MVYEDKSSYTGDWVMGLRHGQGEVVMADGSVYRGQWVNDKPHGKGTLSISTSEYSYNGEGVCVVCVWCGGVFVLRCAWCEGVYCMKMFDRMSGGTLCVCVCDITRWLYCVMVCDVCSGDWVSGMRDGRGEEKSEQYGSYKGAWKGDTKTGYGEERTMVGTVFEGTWDRNRKHGRGVRKMIFGSVDEQVGCLVVAIATV